MEFFPIYKEQMETPEFVNLSPAKKSYYFLLQSMFNKFGQFYYRDSNFAAALNCSDDTIKKARREFVKKGWITVIPGRRDKHGRGLATQYTSVKWSRPPQKDDGFQFSPFQRYSLEMLLNKKLSLDCVVVYMSLSYWSYFHQLEDGAFFITKSQLKELTGLKGMNQIEECIEELYDSFQYASGSHLFEYDDQYHKYKFEKWATPSEPSEDEGNRSIQKRFWDNVMKQGKVLQEKKQSKAKEKELAEVIGICEYFKMRYKDYYGIEPNPDAFQMHDLILATKEIGELDMRHAINRYFIDDIKGLYRSQRRTMKKFLDLRYWEKHVSVK